MIKRKLLTALIIVILILGAVSGAYLLFGRSGSATDLNSPSETEVSALTPEGAFDIHLFPIDMTGDGTLENVVLFKTSENDATLQHIEVLALADEWKSVFSHEVPIGEALENKRLEGVQKMDFEEDGKTEFFLMFINDQFETEYLVLFNDGNGYRMVEKPDDAEQLIVQEGEVKAFMAGFLAEPEGIYETYAYLCYVDEDSLKQDGEAQTDDLMKEVPIEEGDVVVKTAKICRTQKYLSEYHDGKLSRSKVEEEEKNQPADEGEAGEGGA